MPPDSSTKQTLGIRKVAAFPTTHWTVVLQAAAAGSPGSDRAFSELCAKYWYPLYAAVRASGASPPEAEDLVQSFFLRVIEQTSLETLSREGGKFRSYLLTLLKHFIQNEWKKERAIRRGGLLLRIDLDGMKSEVRYQLEPREKSTPEQIFEKNWALMLLERGLKRLEEECRWSKKHLIFTELSPFLTGADRTIPYSIAAQKLGVPEAQIKVQVHRLRRRYGELLREEIALTITDPDDLQQEIHSLIRVAGLGL